MDDRNLIGLLGALGGPVTAGAGGGLVAPPGQRLGPALGAGAGSIGGGVAGMIGGGLGGSLLGGGLGALGGHLIDEDPGEGAALGASIGAAIGGLLGAGGGSFLGARKGFDMGMPTPPPPAPMGMPTGGPPPGMEAGPPGPGGPPGKGGPPKKGKKDKKGDKDQEKEAAVAFAGGCFAKCAEAGVDPADLYHEAVRLGDHRTAKLAAAAWHFGQLSKREKRAFLGKLVGRVGNSFRALGRVGDEFGEFGHRRQWAKGLQSKADEAGEMAREYARRAPQQMNPRSIEQMQSAQRQAREMGQKAQMSRQRANEQLLAYGKEVAPAAGLLAGGAGGLAYGLGDADTTGNKLKNMSNRMLGTNFDTQSRLGALLG